MPAMAPKKCDGFCDVCGSPLMTRADDTEEVIENRLKIFNETNDPLIAFYEQRGILMKYDIKREWTTFQICSAKLKVDCWPTERPSICLSFVSVSIIQEINQSMDVTVW